MEIEVSKSRILFLDDDRARAAAFLAQHPDAVWVETAERCLTLLAEPWEEVHLDHDLGGETLVDHDRDDCGMAVVRWLCEQPRPHLKATRFFIHTHNPNAAYVMVLHLEVMGFSVQARPFGMGPLEAPASGGTWGRSPRAGRIVRWLQSLAHRRWGLRRDRF